MWTPYTCSQFTLRQRNPCGWRIGADATKNSQLLYFSATGEAKLGQGQTHQQGWQHAVCAEFDWSELTYLLLLIGLAWYLLM